MNMLKILFGIYLALIVWIILFKMAVSYEDIAVMTGVRSVNLIPFGEYAVVNNGIDFQEIIYNIVVFIPCGVYVGILNKEMRLYKKVLIVLAISVCMETMQYIFALGRTDISDIIENTAGGAAGAAVIELIRRIAADEIKVRKITAVVMSVITVAVIILIIMITAANI